MNILFYYDIIYNQKDYYTTIKDMGYINMDILKQYRLFIMNNYIIKSKLNFTKERNISYE